MVGLRGAHAGCGGDARWQAERDNDHVEDRAALRREYRAWVRAHHPDRGGDSEAFAIGVRDWQAALRRPPRRPVPGRVVFYRRYGAVGTLARWWVRRRRSTRVR
jgi:hypothetical protein